MPFKSSKPSHSTLNQVRIIAGSLRGRKIKFPNEIDLRPTPDRVRETLFNWLEPRIRGARCLDLFAGSGALCIEAISRGAAQVVAVEYNNTVIQSLIKHKEEWHLDGLEIVNMDTREFLKTSSIKHPQTKFDIIFLDPPYQSSLLEECFALLKTFNGIHAETLLYFESNQPVAKEWFEQWQVIRNKKAGQVYYYLAQRKNSMLD